MFFAALCSLPPDATDHPDGQKETEKDGKQPPWGGGRGYLNLTAGTAKVGILPGEGGGGERGGGTSIEADHEVIVLKLETRANDLHTGV